ncbi:hypothetical protein FKM82_012870 [Ascaphus truei]
MKSNKIITNLRCSIGLLPARGVFQNLRGVMYQYGFWLKNGGNSKRKKLPRTVFVKEKDPVGHNGSFYFDIYGAVFLLKFCSRETFDK